MHRPDGSRNEGAQPALPRTGTQGTGFQREPECFSVLNFRQQVIVTVPASCKETSKDWPLRTLRVRNITCIRSRVRDGRTGVDATNRIASGLFLRIVDCGERAASSTASRNRFRKLVWSALRWATFSERRDLRSGEVDSRASHASLWHEGACTPPRQKRECCGSDQRSRAIREIACDRPFPRCRRSVRNDGWRCGASHFGSGGDPTKQSTVPLAFQAAIATFKSASAATAPLSSAMRDEPESTRHDSCVRQR